jgi:ferredoxin
MRVFVERGACVSCGACWNTCPAVFSLNPCDGFSEIADPYRFCGSRAEGMVPEDLAACAREAACLCPVECIAVGDEHAGWQTGE